MASDLLVKRTRPKSKYIHYERDQIVDGEVVPIKIKLPVKEGPPSKSTMDKEAMLLRQLFELDFPELVAFEALLAQCVDYDYLGSGGSDLIVFACYYSPIVAYVGVTFIWLISTFGVQ